MPLPVRVYICSFILTFFLSLFLSVSSCLFYLTHPLFLSLFLSVSSCLFHLSSPLFRSFSFNLSLSRNLSPLPSSLTPPVFSHPSLLCSLRARSWSWRPHAWRRIRRDRGCWWRWWLWRAGLRWRPWRRQRLWRCVGLSLSRSLSLSCSPALLLSCSLALALSFGCPSIRFAWVSLSILLSMTYVAK
jgi:hypothetical protein